MIAKADIPKLKLDITNQYVSRAALKLESVATDLNINFKNKTVLDVGSSTGGFTEYALRHGALKVVAVDVGSNQLHQSLRQNKQIELHEKTDIRSFKTGEAFDLVLIDVSFISLRDILLPIKSLITKQTEVIAMVKPQFEAGSNLKNKGVIKNEHIRRQILKDFEHWVKPNYIIKNKLDSAVSGAKGNQERFYLMHKGNDKL